MGLQHDTVSMIHSFEQGETESVRDYVNRLKQYINQCPEDEKPSQSRLVSIFLDGLKNSTLHSHLYAQKHTNFNACCLDALDFTNNFKFQDGGANRNAPMRNLPNAAPTTSLNSNQIADIVLRRLGQTSRPQPIGPQQPFTRTTPPAGPPLCGICGGDHRTKQCSNFAPLVNNQPTKKWC